MPRKKSDSLTIPALPNTMHSSFHSSEISYKQPFDSETRMTEKMKRSAPIDETNTNLEPVRSTRSRTRTIHLEEQHRLQLLLGAVQFSMRPDLQALEIVMSNGFLLSKDCKAVVSACGEDWKFQWQNKLAKELPDFAQVKLKICASSFCLDVFSPSTCLFLPLWIKQKPELLRAVKTQQFARHIFDRVNDLKVAAKRSESLRAKARAALPVWGCDVHEVFIYIHEEKKNFDGSIYLRFHDGNFKSFLHVWLNPDLTLWKGIRTWSVYDFQPSWP